MTDFMHREWDLDRVLFVSSPPETAVLARVFTGRATELDAIATAVLDAPRRLLVKGLFGAGKTVTIRQVSRCLSESGKALVVEEMLYASDPSIAHVLLRGLAYSLREEDDYAHMLTNSLLGVEEGQILGSKATAGSKGGIPSFIEGSITSEETRQGTLTFKTTPDDPIPVIRRLIDGAVKRSPNRRIVLVIDDLDKRDPDGVRVLLAGCRELIHDPRCSFVFTGHPLGILRDAYSSAGGIIDREIAVPQMTPEEMRLMVARYLGAGRVRGVLSFAEPTFTSLDVDERDLRPFLIDSLSFIIGRSFGLPRVLNIICFNILMEAAARRYQRIGMNELRVCWDACKSQLRNGIRPDLRDTLELMLQRRESLDLRDMPDDWFDRLRVDRTEELVQRVEYALKSDLLVTRNGQDIVLNALLRDFDEVSESIE